MQTTDVITALRPTLPDVESLFEAFTRETGSSDAVDFVEFLNKTGKLSDEALEAIEQISRSVTGTLDGASPPDDADLAGPVVRPAPIAHKHKLLDDDDEPTPAQDPTVFYRGHDPTPDATPVVMPNQVEAPAPAEDTSAPAVPAAAPAEESAATVASTPEEADGATPAPVEPRPTPLTEPGSGGTDTGAPRRQLRRSSGASGEASAVRGPSAGPPPVPSGVKTANPTNAQKKELLRAPSFPGTPTQTDASTGGAPRDVPGRGYQFVGKIGEGAMGEILIAKDRDLHRTVAYKVMSKDCAENPALSGKFYSEAQITAQLDHPNIVPIYALDRSRNGTLSYTMKMIRGRTYEKFIHQTADFYKAKKPVPEEHSLVTRLEMFLRVCDAMHYAHIRGVIHRDLKPENIMIGAYGEVYVMDWGIAKLWEPSDAKREDLVLVEGYEDDIAPESDDPDEEKDPNQGVIIGTPQYMSPEQAHGRRDIDPRSDQYALGLILYEVVSLTQAVTGKSPIKIVMRQQDGDKNPLKHLAGEKIPTELEGIIVKSTQKEPSQRYANVRELAEDIRRYLRGEAVLARPDTTRQKVQRWVGKHRELTLFLVLMFFTLSGLTVFISVAAQIYLSSVAREREQQVSNRISEAAAQAALIDSEFARYEGILGIVQASAVEMLLRGEPSKEKEFFAADFGQEPSIVPGLVDSKHYKMKISIMEPLVGLPANASEAIEFELSKLQPLQRYLKRSLLLSKNEAAAAYTPKRAEKLIADTGVPLAWVTVGLENGAFIHYPGTLGIGNKLEKYDVAKSPWYKTGEKRQEKTWGKPYTDPSGLGLMLPCATSLYDEDEKFLGVAAVHVPLDYIIDELLVTEGLPEGVIAYLLDEDGQIVIDSTEKGKKRTGMRTNRPFPVPAVEAAVQNRERGGAKRGTNPETGEREMITYNMMNSLGWYYAVRGPEAALLE